MPVVSVGRDKLFEVLGKTYEEKEFQKLCFEFGIELDDVTSELLMKEKEKGNALTDEERATLSDEVIYKIEVSANRYDLLCLEGLGRALRIFLGKEQLPEYRVITPPKNKMEQLTVTSATAGVRPFVVSAILRDVQFDEVSYQSFIDLQEKLHFNICRKRTLVAIGTHDYDTIQGPFTYDAQKPEDIKFIPLKEEKEFDARALFHYYKEEKKQNNLKQYLHIIEDEPLYPVIRDANGVVLSLPPIINGEHSKISINTKNIFIECTATDLTKANIVLNTIVCMFSQYCKDKFSVENVMVKYEEKNETSLTPTMEERVFETDCDYINKGIGINLSPDEMVQSLRKMGMAAVYKQDTGTLSVTAPPTRSDIYHRVDVQEDIAIGFGYNNIPRTIPKSNTVGKPYALNKVSDQIRGVVAEAGYVETLTFVLCSHEDNFAKLRREDDGKTAVILSNPVSKFLDIARTSLLPGVLNTLQSNTGLALPIRVFELSDVVLLDDANEVGARNERRLAAVYGGKTSGFQYIHGLVDRVMEANGYAFEEDFKQLSKEAQDAATNRGVYSYEQTSNPTFFQGADLFVNTGSGNQRLGSFGILHPEVLNNFKVTMPCSALEMNIEPLL